VDNIDKPSPFARFARPRGSTFIVLFALDSLARSTLITIVPLQAYGLLGGAQKLSLLYFLVSISGLLGSMLVPWLVGRISHHRTLILGSSCMIVSAILLSMHALPHLILGLALQMFGAATVAICLNLYVQRHIPRHEFTRFEPMRIVFSGGAWVIGPVMGVYLENHVAIWLPYSVAAAFSLIQLTFYLSMRMGLGRTEPSVTTQQPNPFKFVRRFFRQPRLILAWLLAVSRVGWWGLFYIYGPIYAVESGLGAETGGIISSIGSAGMLTVIFWGWVGRRVGIRNLVSLGFGLAGVLTLAVAAVSDFPWLGAVLLIAAAASTSIIDSSGNVAFLRAVRPRERSEMTAVFATYRDMSRLTFPGIYALLLVVFPLPAVFLVGGGIMIVLSQCARKLPHNLGRETRLRLITASSSQT
jgi:ACDE family multidrug resistance protein